MTTHVPVWERQEQLIEFAREFQDVILHAEDPEHNPISPERLEEFKVYQREHPRAVRFFGDIGMEFRSQQGGGGNVPWPTDLVKPSLEARGYLLRLSVDS